MVYVFHGKDEYSRQEALESALNALGDRQAIDMITQRFNGRVDLKALQGAACTHPFLSPARVVIVEGMLHSKPGKDYLDKLLKWLPSLPPFAHLFFIEKQKVPSNSRLLKTADKAMSCEPLKGMALQQWILKNSEVKIAGDAAELLAAVVEDDLGLAAIELEKLAIYKGGSGTITADDVIQLCPYAAESSIFDLVDAFGMRDRVKTAVLFTKKMQEGADAFSLFGMIVRQYRLLIQAKEMAGSSQQQIAKALRIHPFVAGKMMAQSQRYSMQQLEMIYRRLLDVDAGAKTGQHRMETPLYLLAGAI